MVSLQTRPRQIMRVRCANVNIEFALGDISQQPDMEAAVNAANAWLLPGGGVAGAIHRGAGPSLIEECRPLAPIRPGEAVITSAGNLPNRWVIHCLGPVYGTDEPSDRLLANCYINAIVLAETRRISRIAFPAISTGAFGYPAFEAAQVTAQAVLSIVEDIQYLEVVRFVFIDSSMKAVFAQAFVDASAS